MTDKQAAIDRVREAESISTQSLDLCDRALRKLYGWIDSGLQQVEDFKLARSAILKNLRLQNELLRTLEGPPAIEGLPDGDE